MKNDRIGPLYFDPGPFGVVQYDGDTTEMAFARAEKMEAVRRIRQAWRERERINAAVGYWEPLPPMPELLRDERLSQAAA